MIKNSVIRKDNRIITACYQLTLNEKRLILAAIAKIPFDEEIPEEIELTIQEILQAFPDIGAKNATHEIQDALDRLYERNIRVEDPIKKKKFRWISSTTIYKKGEGKIGFVFTKDTIPYLYQLKEKFTKYRLEDISRFKSVHAIRLYEMLMQFEKTNLVLVDLLKFKERLGLENKYSVFKDLRKWVIEPALKEINEKTNLIVTFKGTRVGRSIQKLEFFFSEK
jgi:plasmid replication initiation protein